MLNSYNEFTIANTLERGVDILSKSGIDNPYLDCEVLICFLIDRDRSYLFLYPEQIIPTFKKEKFFEYIKRRSNREPVAYIIGKKEFWSIDFIVTNNTLIPRPETEILVREAIRFLRLKISQGRKRLTGLDIGTGCGNIMGSIMSEVSDIIFYGVDISRDALKIASKNIARLGYSKSVKLVQGSMLDPFNFNSTKGKDFELVVSNPPYIKSEELPSLMPDVKEYEPCTALDGGTDGLSFYREIISNAGNCLCSGGGMFLEIGFEQGKAVYDMLETTGIFFNIDIVKDYSAKDRVVTCEKI